MKLTKQQQTLVLDNLKLVYKVLFELNLLDNEDMVQEGFLNLCLAAQTYNPEKAKFSTHAYWNIKYGVLSSIQKDNIFNSSSRKSEDCLITDNDALLLGAEGEDILDIAEIHLRLEKVLNELSPQYIKMLKMIYEGFTQSEIAKATNQSQSQVSIILSKMRKEVEERQWSL